VKSNAEFFVTDHIVVMTAHAYARKAILFWPSSFFSSIAVPGGHHTELNPKLCHVFGNAPNLAFIIYGWQPLNKEGPKTIYLQVVLRPHHHLSAIYSKQTGYRQTEKRSVNMVLYFCAKFGELLSRNG